MRLLIPVWLATAVACDTDDKPKTILEVKVDTLVKHDTVTKVDTLPPVVDTIRVPIDTDDHGRR